MNPAQLKLKRIRRWIRLAAVLIVLLLIGFAVIVSAVVADFYVCSTLALDAKAADQPASELIVRQDAMGTLRLTWEAVSGFTQAMVAIVGTLLSLLSLLMAFLVLYWDKTNERRLQCREIYQRLELASIDLFRFECENPSLVTKLWGESEEPNAAPPVLAGSDHHSVKSYVCQMLNLFEMALRFRRDDTMEPEVFGSWVIWMFELCACPQFRRLWSELRLNYVGELRTLFDQGTKIADPGEPGRAAFFKLVASQFENCPHILAYLKA